jgi:RHS repeat-associated protein
MPTTLEHIQYGFDRDSRRTWKRRTLTTNEDDHYHYDALSQVTVAARGNLNLNLTAISGRPASEQSWDYDPTGNWRGFDAAENGNPILDQHRVHDRGNRLTQIEDSPTAMVLDRAGRMRQAAPDADGNWNGTLELTWDAWSRVTSVKNNGATMGVYLYDGLTRRTTREVSGVTWHSYYSDAWRPLEERKNAETTVALSYLWGARHRDDLVRRDRATSGTTLNETRFVLMDYFSAAAITDEDGEVKERYSYTAFGVRRVLTPEFASRPTSECAFEFGFHGQFLDTESGLYNYGYRYYSPHLGRWMCKDPIGEKGGVNLYTLTYNDPLNLHDYLGRYPQGRGSNSGQWPKPENPSHSIIAPGRANCMGHACTGNNSTDIRPKPGQSMKDALSEYGIECDAKKISNEAECKCPDGYAKIIFTIWLNMDPANKDKNGLTDPMKWDNPDLTQKSDPHFYRQEPGASIYTSIPGAYHQPTEPDSHSPQEVNKRLIDPVTNKPSETYCCCQCPDKKK